MLIVFPPLSDSRTSTPLVAQSLPAVTIPAMPDPDPLAQARRCLGCGYILDGLPENRCPECGQPFDPADPSSFLSQRFSGRPYLLGIILCVAGVVLPPATAFLLRHRAVPNWVVEILLPLGTVMWCTALVVGGTIYLKSILALQQPRHKISRRAELITAFIIGLLMCGAFMWIIYLLARL